VSAADAGISDVGIESMRAIEASIAALQAIGMAMTPWLAKKIQAPSRASVRYRLFRK
jgi:hypothetical protein